MRGGVLTQIQKSIENASNTFLNSSLNCASTVSLQTTSLQHTDQYSCASRVVHAYRQLVNNDYPAYTIGTNSDTHEAMTQELIELYLATKTKNQEKEQANANGLASSNDQLGHQDQYATWDQRLLGPNLTKVNQTKALLSKDTYPGAKVSFSRQNDFTSNSSLFKVKDPEFTVLNYDCYTDYDSNEAVVARFSAQPLRNPCIVNKIAKGCERVYTLKEGGSLRVKPLYTNNSAKGEQKKGAVIPFWIIH